jgi:AcrR family transcriptional regulator
MSRGRKRRVAGRDEILAAARAIGVRSGWEAVTIRSVAQKLGYSSPLLYEHFRDKRELLTQIAVEAVAMLDKQLAEEMSEGLEKMAERYWTFMLENRQLYRLMNGMDGVPIDKQAVGRAAESLCNMIADRVRAFAGEKITEAQARELADELWALLHGMAALYLDRLVPFDVTRITNATMRLVRAAL